MPRQRKERPGFIIYHETYSPLFQTLSRQKMGELIYELFIFSMTGADPENLNKSLYPTYVLLREKILRDKAAYEQTCEDRSEAGKKAWQKRNGTDTEDDFSDEYEDMEDTPDTSSETAQNYGTYGNVHLSSGQYAVIQKQYPDDWESLIEDLDSWIESKGKQNVFKNHLTALQNFANRQGLEPCC